MGLYGKGFYIWQIPRCDGGNPQAIARRAAAAGLSHVLIKIADGSNYPYNIDKTSGKDLVPAVRDALREVGIQVWGWHYVRGTNPSGEANLAIARLSALKLDGYVIDAEHEYKESGKSRAALLFMNTLRRSYPKLPMALSSYRYPQGHRRLPFTEFLQSCDYAMPQVYFEQAHNPDEQLRRSVQEYADWHPARPVIPTAPTYATPVWTPTVADINLFLTTAKELGLVGVNAWSWDWATKTGYVEFWDTVAKFDWAPIPPAAEMAEGLIYRLNQQDPSSLALMYHENAAHVTGARTIVGRQKIAEWYQALTTQMLPEGRYELTGQMGQASSKKFTWSAQSSKGKVVDGSDTLGIRDGKIQYHYTHFTVS